MHTSESRLADVVDTVRLAMRSASPFLVLTANIHHVRMMHENADFRWAYGQADLITADGWPIALTSSAVQRRRIPRVTGADLMPAVLQSAPSGSRVLVVGNRPESVGHLVRTYAGLRFSHYDIQPNDFADDQSLGQALAGARTVSQTADLVIISMSAPRQEIVAAHLRVATNCAILPCGAGLDFTIGAAARAPLWMRRLGLEWLFRICHDPRRLARRYARDLPRFVQSLVSTGTK